MIHGEYWILDSGDSLYADGDMVDYNHEMIAFNAALGLNEEELDKLGIEANANGIDFQAAASKWIEKNLPERFWDMDWTDGELLQAIRQADIKLDCAKEYMALWGPDVESDCKDSDVFRALGMIYLVEAGADEEFLKWYLGDAQGDARDYAIEKMGWIRVQNDNFEMWQFTDTELDMIRNFDGWQDVDEEDMKNDEISVYTAADQNRFNIPTGMLFDDKLSASDIVRLLSSRDELAKYERENRQYEGEEHEHLSLNPIKVRPESEYDQKELAIGIEVEKEHSNSYRRRSITARQHLEEDPHYYSKLKEAGLNPDVEDRGKEHFQFLFGVFNVQKAKQILIAKPREPQHLSLENVSKWFDGVRLNKEKAMSDEVDVTMPVIAISIAGGCFPIDGWHRMYKAFRLGMKKVPVLVLNKKETKSVIVKNR